MVVLVLIGLFVYRTISRPQTSASSSAAAPVAPDARIAAAEAQIRQAAAQGRRVPISFAITDPELTASVNKAISSGQSPVPVTDVRVNTVPGQVNIQGQVKVVAVASAPF